MARRKVSSKTRQNKAAQTKHYEEWVKKQSNPCIISRGSINPMLKELEKEIRNIFQPLTFTHFHTFANQKLQDIAKALPQLKSSHLISLSETSNKFSYIKIARSPSGPTLTFRIEQYALSCDIMISKDPSSSINSTITLPKDFFTTSHAFLITSGFSHEIKHQHLMLSTFQNLFPTFDINDSDLKAFKRCVIFHIDHDTEEIDFRQYSVKRTQITDIQSFAMISQSKLLKLTTAEDISEAIPNLESIMEVKEKTHESLLEDIDAKSQNLDEIKLNKPSFDINSNSQTSLNQKPKFNIKLVEIGPRMKLKLVKIEENFYQGNVIYHAFLTPNEEHIADNEMRIEKAKELKKQRKEEIAINVEKKRVYKESLSKRNNKKLRKERKIAKKAKNKIKNKSSH